jgi:hypothetical protein
MDWTDLTFSQVLEQEIQEWKKFRWALRKEDQQVFDQLLEKSRLHVEAGNNVSRPWPFETILISILVEQEKALVELKEKIEGYEEMEEGKARKYLSPFS